MLKRAIILACAIAAINSHAFAAAPQGKAPVKVARSSDAAGANGAARKAGARASAKLGTSPTKPSVVLSQAHRDTCSKFLGDDVNGITVTDMDGKSHSLKDLLSDRLTVLIFWSEHSYSGLEQFRRVPVDVLAKFASFRVKVVAANVGGDPSSTRRLTGDAADKIVSLVDQESKLLDQFATSKLPRTYVLDKNGKILWLDLEYSQSTIRSLDNALTYFLAQGRK